MPKVAPEYSVEYKEEARKRIMEIGIQVFAEKGYHQTTMDDVAKRLNVSKGTIYLYFNSKEELVKAIAGRFQDKQKEALRSWFTEGLSGKLELKPSSELDRREYHKRRYLARFAFELFFQSTRDPSLRKNLVESVENRRQIIAELVDDLKRKGEITPESTDMRSLSLGLLAFLLGIQALLFLDVDSSEVSRASREAMRAMLGAS
jgi:AcrR family transcriptional regulator